MCSVYPNMHLGRGVDSRLGVDMEGCLDGGGGGGVDRWGWCVVCIPACTWAGVCG